MKHTLLLGTLAIVCTTCSEPQNTPSPGAAALPGEAVEPANYSAVPSGPHALILVDTAFLKNEKDGLFHWRINGMAISTRQNAVYVPVHAGFDTILAFFSRRTDSLVVLCDLKFDSTYRLVYNECCNDFYFFPEYKFGYSNQGVDFQIINAKKGEKWLGAFSNTAVLLEPGRENLLTLDLCAKPMMSNYYHLYVMPWVAASLDTTICEVLSRTGKEIGGFVPKDRFSGIWYTFLHGDRLLLTYDARRDVYTLERIGE